MLHGSDHRQVLFKVQGLCYITIGMIGVAARYVGLCLRAAEHNDRDRSERRVSFDVLKKLTTVHLRQVQIQQDEVGARGCACGGAPQEIQRLHAISGYMEMSRWLPVRQPAADQSHVAGVVFDQQNVVALMRFTGSGAGAITHAVIDGAAFDHGVAHMLWLRAVVRLAA